MKHFLYLSLFIFSCSAEKAGETEPVPVKDTITHLEPSPALPVPPPDDSVSINGTALYSGHYCGGARPSEEMQAEIRKPKPFYLGSLYIRTKGSGEKIKVRTNQQGKFNCRLKPGQYEVLMASNMTTDGDYWYGPEVEKAWWKKQVFARFTYADTNKKNIRFTLDLICDPSSLRRP